MKQVHYHQAVTDHKVRQNSSNQGLVMQWAANFFVTGGQCLALGFCVWLLRGEKGRGKGVVEREPCQYRWLRAWPSCRGIKGFAVDGSCNVRT